MQLMSNSGKGNRRIQEGQLVGSLSSVVSSDVITLRREVLVSTMQAGAGVTRDVEPIDLCEALSLGDHLTGERKAEIVAMLSHKNVRPVFSMGDREIGQLDVEHHCINLLDETPIYQKPRQFPEPISNEIERLCQKLELMDVIEPSSSA